MRTPGDVAAAAAAAKVPLALLLPPYAAANCYTLVARLLPMLPRRRNCCRCAAKGAAASDGADVAARALLPPFAAAKERLIY